MVLDRYLIAKGLVGSFEVVFDKPLGKLAIEHSTVCRHVAELDELFIKGSVEAFINGIVGGCFDARKVALDFEVGERLSEGAGKLASVVSREVLDPGIKEVVDPPQKVRGVA